MLISSVSRSEHLDLFDRGIATKLDLAYAGPQSVRIAQMVEDGTVQIGAIHTYVELYARMFVDLSPDVVLLCADKADRNGASRRPARHPRPVLARRTQRWRHPRADHPVGPVGDDGHRPLSRRGSRSRQPVPSCP
jgi:hypothetical protein